MAPGFVANNVPQSVVNEGASGKYALFAIDPSRASRVSAPVSLNVVEIKSSGRITLHAVQQGANEMSQHLSGMGARVTLDEVKVVPLNGVDIGVVNSSVVTARGSMRMVQYMIPGETKIGVLTYACPMEDSDHYRPIFESSAMATTGAYDYSGIGGIGGAFGKVWLFGAIAAIVAVIVTLARANQSKPRAAVPMQSAMPTAWDCPNCKRRVPMRIAECRCGTPQPGTTV